MVHLDRLLLKDSTWANRQNEQSCLYQNKCHAKPITIYSSSLSTAAESHLPKDDAFQSRLCSLYNPCCIQATTSITVESKQHILTASTYTKMSQQALPLHNSILKIFPNKAQQETQTVATNVTPYLHPLALLTKQL